MHLVYEVQSINAVYVKLWQFIGKYETNIKYICEFGEQPKYVAELWGLN